jgi:uncharacterized protein (DUF2345 family)
MNQDGSVTISAAKDLALQAKKGGSQITMNQDGSVTISAAKDLALQAKNGTITLDAQNVNVKVENTMDVS